MSQFRKKKSGVVRDKQSSIMSISKRLASNNTADFKTELEDIEHENDNLLGSLIGEQDPDRRVEDILRQIDQSQRASVLKNSKGDSGLRQDRRSLSPINKTDPRLSSKLKQEETKEKNENGSTVDKHVLQSNVNISKQYEMADMRSMGKQIPEISLQKPDELVSKKSYGSNKEVALLVLALKKLAKTVDEDNTKLKKQNLEYTMREEEYKKKVKTLTSRVQELELETKLSRDRHTDHIKFDLEDLDARLKTMDDNLQKATGENSQERFLDDVVVRNKDYVNKSQENAASMKRLRENLTALKSTLLSLNTRSV